MMYGIHNPIIYISESDTRERYGRIYIAQNATQIDPACFSAPNVEFWNSEKYLYYLQLGSKVNSVIF